MWKRVAQTEGPAEPAPRGAGDRGARPAVPRSARQPAGRGVRRSAQRGAQPEDSQALEERIRVLDAALQQRTAELFKLQDELAARRQMDLELYELAPVAYATLDRTGTVVGANLALSKLLGLPRGRLLGARLARYTTVRDAPALAELVRLAVSGDEKVGRALSFRRPDGEMVHARVEAVGVGAPRERTVHLALLDDTERRRLAERSRRAAKLDEVGLAASAIAHDFNNVLLGIVGCADLALEHLSSAGQGRLLVQEIKAIALRGSMLTGKLLAVERPEEEAAPSVDLREVVERSEPLLLGLLGDRVRLAVRTAPAPVPVRLHPVEIEQILVNLATNARRAMRDGGHLAVEVATTDLSPRELDSRRRTGRRDFAVLKVTDDGPGMDAATRAHAFDPFFSASPTALGTGLGLATVREIVTRAGGMVDLWSEIGRGTTVRILFPLAEGEPVTAPDRAPPAAPAGAAAGPEEPPEETPEEPPEETPAVPEPGAGAGESAIAPAPRARATVFLLEDDEASRAALEIFLERRGYRVLVASNGEEARRVCREHIGSLDIIVSDLGLEGSSGVKLAAAARALHPRAAVIFISGRAPGDPLVKQALRVARTTFLRKPFELDQLLRAMDTLRAAGRDDVPPGTPTGG